MSFNAVPRNWFNKKFNKNSSTVLNMYNQSLLEFPKNKTQIDKTISEDQIKITFNGVDTFLYFSDICRNFDKMLKEIEEKINREKIIEVHSGLFDYKDSNYKIFWTLDMNNILLLDIVIK